MKQITKTLIGTEEEFGLLFLNSLSFPTNELPILIEQRFCVLDTQDIQSEKGFEELTEDEWMNECERQGRIYSSLENFVKAFNEEEINTSIDVVKVINVAIQQNKY